MDADAVNAPGKAIQGPWLIYGAYGFTGRLLVREALGRGHAPVLAGRSRAGLEAFVEALGAEGLPAGACECRDFPLDDPGALRRGIRGMRAVLHAAGPFVETGLPMMEACLDEGAHYLDITGEVPVFEAAFALDGRAREGGVVLMPGVGMDVVPTDALAAILSEALPDATRLELALQSPGGPSAGTAQTVIEGIPAGLLVRRAGRLEPAWPGRRSFRREVDFGPEAQSEPGAARVGGCRPVAPYTWGDLSTAWRTTGIPDITCYLATPGAQVRMLPWALPLLRMVLAVPAVRRWARSRIAARTAGPDAAAMRTGRTRAWGRVENAAGASREAVLECPEGYRFTALAGVRAIEAVLGRSDGASKGGSEGGLRGALTPAGALGAAWVLGLPGVRRIELPSRTGAPS